MLAGYEIDFVMRLQYFITMTATKTTKINTVIINIH